MQFVLSRNLYRDYTIRQIFHRSAVYSIDSQRRTAHNKSTKQSKLEFTIEQLYKYKFKIIRPSLIESLLPEQHAQPLNLYKGLFKISKHTESTCNKRDTQPPIAKKMSVSSPSSHFFKNQNLNPLDYYGLRQPSVKQELMPSYRNIEPKPTRDTSPNHRSHSLNNKLNIRAHNQNQYAGSRSALGQENINAHNGHYEAEIERLKKRIQQLQAEIEEYGYERQANIVYNKQFREIGRLLGDEEMEFEEIRGKIEDFILLDGHSADRKATVNLQQYQQNEVNNEIHSSQTHIQRYYSSSSNRTHDIVENIERQNTELKREISELKDKIQYQKIDSEAMAIKIVSYERSEKEYQFENQKNTTKIQRLEMQLERSNTQIRNPAVGSSSSLSEIHSAKKRHSNSFVQSHGETLTFKGVQISAQSALNELQNYEKLLQQKNVEIQKISEKLNQHQFINHSEASESSSIELKYQQLQKKYEHFTVEYEKLDQKLLEYERKIQQNHRSIEQYQHMQQDYRKLESGISEMESRLESSKHQVTNYKQLYEDVSVKLQSKEQQFSDLLDENKRLKDELIEEKGQIVKLGSQMEVLTEKVVSLEKRQRELLQRNEEVSQQRESAMSTKQQQQRNQTKVYELQSETMELRNKVNILQGQIRSKDQSMLRSTQKYEELMSIYEELREKYTRSTEEYNSNLKRLTASLDAAANNQSPRMLTSVNSERADGIESENVSSQMAFNSSQQQKSIEHLQNNLHSNVRSESYCNEASVSRGENNFNNNTLSRNFNLNSQSDKTGEFVNQYEHTHNSSALRDTFEVCNQRETARNLGGSVEEKLQEYHYEINSHNLRQNNVSSAISIRNSSSHHISEEHNSSSSRVERSKVEYKVVNVDTNSHIIEQQQQSQKNTFQKGTHEQIDATNSFGINSQMTLEEALRKISQLQAEVTRLQAELQKTRECQIQLSAKFGAEHRSIGITSQTEYENVIKELNEKVHLLETRIKELTLEDGNLTMSIYEKTHSVEKITVVKNEAEKEQSKLEIRREQIEKENQNMNDEENSDANSFSKLIMGHGMAVAMVDTVEDNQNADDQQIQAAENVFSTEKSIHQKMNEFISNKQQEVKEEAKQEQGQENRYAYDLPQHSTKKIEKGPETFENMELNTANKQVRRESSHNMEIRQSNHLKQQINHSHQQLGLGKQEDDDRLVRPLSTIISRNNVSEQSNTMTGRKGHESHENRSVESRRSISPSPQRISITYGRQSKILYTASALAENLPENNLRKKQHQAQHRRSHSRDSSISNLSIGKQTPNSSVNIKTVAHPQQSYGVPSSRMMSSKTVRPAGQQYQSPQINTRTGFPLQNQKVTVSHRQGSTQKLTKEQIRRETEVNDEYKEFNPITVSNTVSNEQTVSQKRLSLAVGGSEMATNIRRSRVMSPFNTVKQPTISDHRHHQPFNSPKSSSFGNLLQTKNNSALIAHNEDMKSHPSIHELSSLNAKTTKNANDRRVSTLVSDKDLSGKTVEGQNSSYQHYQSVFKTRTSNQIGAVGVIAQQKSFEGQYVEDHSQSTDSGIDLEQNQNDDGFSCCK